MAATETATATPPPTPPPPSSSAPPRAQSTTMASGAVTSPPSPGISVELHGEPKDARPPLASHLSAPVPAAQTFPSPMRQHRRTPSQHREVKETLNARTEYANDDQDGYSHHKINQYIIKDEIGRGSYGAVHLATDQYGNEYAMKEFSKARLRKRVQSNILRQGPRRLPMGMGFSPSRLAPGVGPGGSEAKDAIFLIRQEVAIMKKLNHPNLVQLIEVLDDPEEDSLYMVLEMCKKGVIMKVGLGEPADPYDEESCRCWFRDLILGIEYLHAQGVVHRDIKPDNLLLTGDDVLKIVDFGVSEMFEKPDRGMRTAKSAGSPAFLPPELCVARHGDVSGAACDLWSMGVTLYCLRYGRIPFERTGVLEMYEAIKTEEVRLPADENPDFVDLMHRILEKDPEKRITMAELREHPWVTKKGTDPLLSAEENCANPVEPPDALELSHAFTRRMSHLLCVMKAMSKFKGLLHSRASTPRRRESPVPAAPDEGSKAATPQQPTSSSPTTSEEDRKNAEEAARLVEERRQILRTASLHDYGYGEKGHAHDPTDHQPPFLGIGIGAGGRHDADSHPATGHAAHHSSAQLEVQDEDALVVSDSPMAADFNVYDRAYESEVRRIRALRAASGGGDEENNSAEPRLYLTRQLREGGRYALGEGLLGDEGGDGDGQEGSDPVADVLRDKSNFASVVARVVKDAKASSASA